MKMLEKRLAQISTETYSTWIYRVLGTVAMLVVAYVILHWLVGNAGWVTAVVSAVIFLIAMLLYYTRQGIVLAGIVLAIGGCFIAITSFWQMFLALRFVPPEAASALFLVVGTIITATILALRIPRRRPARTMVFLVFTIIISNISWLPLSTNMGYAFIVLPVIFVAGLILLTPFALFRFLWRQITASKRLVETDSSEPSSLVRYLSTKLGEEYIVLGQRKILYGFRGRWLSVADAIVVGPTGVYTICQGLPHGSMRKNAEGVWKIDGAELSTHLARPVACSQAIIDTTCGLVNAFPVAAATPKTRLFSAIIRTTLLAPRRTDVPITTAAGAAEYITEAKPSLKARNVGRAVRRIRIHTDPA